MGDKGGPGDTGPTGKPGDKVCERYYKPPQ